MIQVFLKNNDEIIDIDKKSLPVSISKLPGSDNVESIKQVQSTVNNQQ